MASYSAKTVAIKNIEASLLVIFESSSAGPQMNTNKENNGWLSISLDDFHHAMETAESYKTNFGQVKRKIIEPAVKELTEKDNWMIDWKSIKLGRKVVRLEFWFRKDDQFKIDIK
ncbi:replication initiation protein [Xenorhabdus nematophila]|nr:replication initiation protein [Xenorhabdus nematophila]